MKFEEEFGTLRYDDQFPGRHLEVEAFFKSERESVAILMGTDFEEELKTI